MNTAKKPERPRLARIISMEGAIAAFGLYSLGSGLWQGEVIPIFWGLTILVGLVVLTLVRRRDWQRHWELVARQHASTSPRDSDPPDA
ncbi:MAG: hypothetical protein ACYC9I_02840 [Desulfuromonadales bacterium]